MPLPWKRLFKRRYGKSQDAIAILGLGIAVRLIIALTVLTGDRAVSGMQTQDQSGDDSMYYDIPGYYLAKIGPKLNCHFTIEHLEGSDTFVETREALDPNVTTVEGLVRELQKKIPGATVILDRKNKDHPVIHLIESPLAKKRDYVLDRKIDVTYSGIVGDLAGDLEKRIPGIEAPRSGTGPTEAFNDHVTKVKIDAKQEPIRDILTHCVDLNKYNWLIWTAKTSQQEDKAWKTQVRFSGPKPVGRAAP